MNNKRYFSVAFDQNNEIVISQKSYARGKDEEGLVSFEKSKYF